MIQVFVLLASIIYLESTTTCLHDKPISIDLLLTKGLRMAVLYFVRVLLLLFTPKSNFSSHPSAVTVSDNGWMTTLPLGSYVFLF